MTILPFRRPNAGGEPIEDRQRLIRLAAEGEYLERTVVDFSSRALGELTHLKRNEAAAKMKKEPGR